jgi:pimeloyl-ACP methyl ester carboxylesterase
MKIKNLFLVFLAITLLLFSDGCKKQLIFSAMSTDGVKIVFNQQGNRKPAIIFVHGWSNNKSIWDTQFAHFSKKYKAIAVDHAGSGESGNNRKS